MLTQYLKTWLPVFLLPLLFACAPKTTVVLVEDPQGKTGRVSVTSDAGQVELDRNGQATVVSSKSTAPTAPTTLSTEEINRRFGSALAIQPMQPIHFLLYFEDGTTNLVAASLAELPKIIATITERQSTEISSIGHSDTAGDPQYNLRLSQRRAEEVSRLLVEAGVAAEYIQSSSHGEENPLVPTGDNVSEPKNRRVEVVVR